MLVRTFACVALSLSALALSWSSRAPGGGEACRAAQEARRSVIAEDPYSQEIFFAVLEGLYADGVANETVDAIVELDPATGWPANFVYACPICMPAFDAFRVYRARPEFFGKKMPQDTWGAGLESKTRAEIEHPDMLVRQRAIQGLVQDWIERRLDKLRLDEAERAAWRNEMEIRRKQGMSQLQNYQDAKLGSSYAQMKECPFCEAANGACKPRR